MRAWGGDMPGEQGAAVFAAASLNIQRRPRVAGGLSPGAWDPADRSPTATFLETGTAWGHGGLAHRRPPIDCRNGVQVSSSLAIPFSAPSSCPGTSHPRLALPRCLSSGAPSLLALPTPAALPPFRVSIHLCFLLPGRLLSGSVSPECSSEQPLLTPCQVTCPALGSQSQEPFPDLTVTIILFANGYLAPLAYLNIYSTRQKHASSMVVGSD